MLTNESLATDCFLIDENKVFYVVSKANGNNLYCGLLEIINNTLILINDITLPSVMNRIADEMIQLNQHKYLMLYNQSAKNRVITIINNIISIDTEKTNMLNPTGNEGSYRLGYNILDNNKILLITHYIHGDFYANLLQLLPNNELIIIDKILIYSSSRSQAMGDIIKMSNGNYVNVIFKEGFIVGTTFSIINDKINVVKAYQILTSEIDSYQFMSFNVEKYTKDKILVAYKNNYHQLILMVLSNFDDVIKYNYLTSYVGEVYNQCDVLVFEPEYAMITFMFQNLLRQSRNGKNIVEFIQNQSDIIKGFSINNNKNNRLVKIKVAN